MAAYKEAHISCTEKVEKDEAQALILRVVKFQKRLKSQLRFRVPFGKEWKPVHRMRTSVLMHMKILIP